MTDNPNDPTPEEIAALAEAMGEKPVPESRTRKAKAKVEDEERLHQILSNEDFRKAQAAARERIEKERRAAAMKDVEEREAARLRVEEGLTTGIGAMDDIVSFTVDLPLFAAYILINGPVGGSIYWHGKTYDVPRHVANSLAEMQHRMWRHDEQTDGKSFDQMLHAKRNSTINARTGAINNAPRRFDA